MHTFFHGWRRKAGVVTLLIACAFAAGWIRSWIVFDELRFMIGSHRQFVSSEYGRFHWVYEWPKDSAASSHNFSGFSSSELGINDPDAIYGKYFVFSYYLADAESEREYLLVAFSYWVVAVPFTLLSAYLILWKPRKRA